MLRQSGPARAIAAAAFGDAGVGEGHRRVSACLGGHALLSTPRKRRPRWATAALCGVGVAGALLVIGLRLRIPEHPPPLGAQPHDIDGLRIWAVDEGPGDASQTVLLLHGTPGSIDDWSPVRSILRRRYRVVTVERPGMGVSDPPRGVDEHRLGIHADRIYRLVRQLGVRNAIVVGWSYGGGVALRMTVDHPDFVAGLVHLCGVAPGFIHMFRYGPHAAFVRAGALLELPIVGGVLSDWIIPVALSVMDPGIWLRRQFGPDWAHVPRDWVDRRVRMLQSPSVLRSSRRELVHLSADLEALHPRLTEIRQPTRVVSCELDSLVPRSVADELTRALPNAEQIVVAGAGHSFHLVRAAELVAIVDELAAGLRP